MTNVPFVLDQSTAQLATTNAIAAINAIDITNIDITKSCQDLDNIAIRISNWYYIMYGSDASVENLAWSADRIMNTCEDALKENIREGLVGVSRLEAGGTFVLNLMLDSDGWGKYCASVPHT